MFTWELMNFEYMNETVQRGKISFAKECSEKKHDVREIYGKPNI